MRVALVSEHASPLAPLGGVDAGGQNVHVAEIAAQFVRDGHDVTVYTRRDAPHLPEVAEVEDPGGHEDQDSAEGGHGDVSQDAGGRNEEDHA